ncbi:MAG: AraC family transcriptional regulator [Actinomycetota bacterium]
MSVETDTVVAPLLLHLRRSRSEPWSALFLSAVAVHLSDAFVAQPVPLRFPTDARALEVADALLADPAHRDELLDWAPRVGASERTLRRLFAEQTGLSFGRWRSRLRLHASAELLSNGVSVAETARRCGFASSSAFSRAFVGDFGVNPSQYRSHLDSIGTAMHERLWPEGDEDRPAGRDRRSYADSEALMALEEDLMTGRVRMTMAAAAAGLLLSSGCSADDGGSDTGLSESSMAAAADADAASSTTTTTAADNEEPQPDDGAVATTAPGVEQPALPREIEHAGGVTEVPARAERIVTPSEAILTHLVSVGVLPVGIPDNAISNWLGPLVEAGALMAFDSSEMSPVGLGGQLNFEAIAALQPDLILLDFNQVDSYELASEIAPTVIVSRDTNADWQSAFDQTMAAAGVEEEAADEVRGRYEALLAEVPLAAAELEVSFVRGAGDANFLLDAEAAFAGSVALDGGFGVDVGDNPADEPDRGFLVFSNEQLGEIDGDLLITTAARDGQPSSISTLLESPLWDQIPAVQNGDVLEFAQPIYNGGTYVAAEALLRGLIDAASDN